VLAENANLHEQNRRLAQHILELEDRLSELLGQQAFERSGLGAAMNTTTLQAELEWRDTSLDDLASDALAARTSSARNLESGPATWDCSVTARAVGSSCTVPPPAMTCPGWSPIVALG
jgi:hypothetical protein